MFPLADAVNGVPTCLDDKAQNGFLRKELGFKGLIVSDCDAVGDVYAKEPSGHGYTSAVESFEHQPCIFS